MGVRKRCQVCLIAGIMLLAHASYAQSGPDPQLVSYYRDVALGAIGLLVMLVGFNGVLIDRRLRAVESQLTDTREMVLKEYHSKADIKEVVSSAIVPLRERMESFGKSIEALHRRLDQGRSDHGRNSGTGGSD